MQTTANMNSKIELSIVIPLYNEEANLDYLFERLERVLNGLGMMYEIVCAMTAPKTTP